MKTLADKLWGNVDGHEVKEHEVGAGRVIDGSGNAAAGYPDIGGQPTGYTIAQLTAYREGERMTDENMGGMMRGVAHGLTDKEIAALADYIQGLH